MGDSKDTEAKHSWMKLYDNSDQEAETPDVEFTGTCCSLDDVSDARRVADHIGIPFLLLRIICAAATQ